MKKILFRDGVFWLVDEAERYPIPPNYVVDGPAVIKVRMYATQSGKSGWFIAYPDGRVASPYGGSIHLYEFYNNDPIPLHEEIRFDWITNEDRYTIGLNDAPFNPVLRAVVKSFVWCPAALRDCTAYRLMTAVRDFENPVVVQTDYAGSKWAATVLKPVADPLRSWAERVYNRIRQTRPLSTQGHLSIFKIEGGVEVPPPTCFKSEDQWFYNHAILNHAGFAYRVVERMAVGILKVDGTGYILSPNHPKEYIELPQGIYVLTHPLPDDPWGAD